MGAIDDFDHLTVQNVGLRYIERRGYQAIEYQLLRMVLVNIYKIALSIDVLEPRQINFRNQKDLRDQLYDSLLLMEEKNYRAIKKRVALVNPEIDLIEIFNHIKIKLEKLL